VVYTEYCISRVTYAKEEEVAEVSYRTCIYAFMGSGILRKKRGKVATVQSTVLALSLAMAGWHHSLYG
jgi:hypothetical protein